MTRILAIKMELNCYALDRKKTTSRRQLDKLVIITCQVNLKASKVPPYSPNKKRFITNIINKQISMVKDVTNGDIKITLLEIHNFARTIHEDFARKSPHKIITRTFNEGFARKSPGKSYDEDLVWNLTHLVLASDLARKWRGHILANCPR